LGALLVQKAQETTNETSDCSFFTACAADYRLRRRRTGDESCIESGYDCTQFSFNRESQTEHFLDHRDDMGFSDVGAYGSEVATPNLDALASEGLSFTNFHVGATCSPTRSLLLTGVDNRRSGLGNMHEFLSDAQRDQPGYEGYLNKSVVTTPI